MNIFRALSQGDGSISETNVTSFFSYILNENNDYSAPLLLLILDEIESRLDEFKVNNVFSLSESNIRLRARDFKSKYSYGAIPEFRLQHDGTIQDVDILVTITDRTTENDCCYLLIENKIKISALKREQCTEQYKLFNQIDDFQKTVPVISILISPDVDKFSEMLEDVEKENSNSVWLKWSDEKNNSIVDILKILMSYEYNSEISPMNSNVKYILKSFIDFLSTLYSSKGSRNNFSVAGSEVIEETDVVLKGETYFLKRYDNNMIRLFDKNLDLLDRQVKPVLRKIIEEYRLGIDLECRPRKKKNTQRLGKEVIRGLKEYKVCITKA